MFELSKNKEKVIPLAEAFHDKSINDDLMSQSKPTTLPNSEKFNKTSVIKQHSFALSKGSGK